MTNHIEKALAAKGIDLPTPAAPVASYVPAVEAGGLLHISGQVSMNDGKLITGRLGVFVNSTADYTDHPKVANGCSDMMEVIFGAAGQHARSAVGVASLPLGVAVEVDAIIALKPE